jgi:hypothetical protein
MSRPARGQAHHASEGGLPRRARLALPRWIARLPWARLIPRAPDPLIRRYLVGERAPPEAVHEVRAALAEVSPAVLAARVRLLLDFDYASLPPISVPALYLRAKRDRLLDARVAAATLAKCPGARLAGIDAPHFVLYRAPADAWTAMIAWQEEESKSREPRTRDRVEGRNEWKG